MRAAAERLVYRRVEGSWVVWTSFEGVLVSPVVCVVVFQLRAVVLNGEEQGTQLSSTNTSSMTWQCNGVVRGVERGF